MVHSLAPEPPRPSAPTERQETVCPGLSHRLRRLVQQRVRERLRTAAALLGRAEAPLQGRLFTQPSPRCRSAPSALTAPRDSRHTVARPRVCASGSQQSWWWLADPRYGLGLADHQCPSVAAPTCGGGVAGVWQERGRAGLRRGPRPVAQGQDWAPSVPRPSSVPRPTAQAAWEGPELGRRSHTAGVAITRLT